MIWGKSEVTRHNYVSYVCNRLWFSCHRQDILWCHINVTGRDVGVISCDLNVMWYESHVAYRCDINVMCVIWTRWKWYGVMFVWTGCDELCGAVVLKWFECHMIRKWCDVWYRCDIAVICVMCAVWTEYGLLSYESDGAWWCYMGVIYLWCAWYRQDMVCCHIKIEWCDVYVVCCDTIYATFCSPQLFSSVYTYTWWKKYQQSIVWKYVTNSLPLSTQGCSKNCGMSKGMSKCRVLPFCAFCHFSLCLTMSAQLMKSKFVRRPSSARDTNYLSFWCSVSFQILVAASPGNMPERCVLNFWKKNKTFTHIFRFR